MELLNTSKSGIDDLKCIFCTSDNISRDITQEVITLFKCNDCESEWSVTGEE